MIIDRAFALKIAFGVLLLAMDIAMLRQRR